MEHSTVTPTTVTQTIASEASVTQTTAASSHARHAASHAPLFDAVLIANRGEIAVRVIRTLRALGIRSVAIHSPQDADALHVREADEAVALRRDDARSTYLDIEQVIAAAQATGAQAIHPGYGFLAENAAFARACADAGIVFIGPPASAIETMGDKIAARAAVESRGVPTVPGIAEPGLDDAALIAGAERVGFPVLIKPSAGGGGKGMHRVDDAAELPDALARARREAASAFGDDTLFIERFVTNPRHIEVQVLADEHGTVLHLGERECSLQRRHQKVIEEAPSPLLGEAERACIGSAAVETAKSVGYVGAGTVEFIVSADRPDEPFFMEMNTRLQVEHPVTEMVTGVDLVEQQLRVAAGERLTLAQEAISLSGHAIEARIYAEDAAAGFLPTGGTVEHVTWPEGEGVRVDAAIHDGSVVTSLYDPMLAKVIAHGTDRAAALARLRAALAATRVEGVQTNRGFLLSLLAQEDVVAGDLDTGLIERHPELATERPSDAALAAFALAERDGDRKAHRPGRASASGPWNRRDGWRVGDAQPASVRVAWHGGEALVELLGAADAAPAHSNAGTARSHADQRDRSALSQHRHTPQSLQVRVDGGDWRDATTERDGSVAVGDDRARWAGSGASALAMSERGDWQLTRVQRTRRGRDAAAAEPTLESPMPGAVVAVAVEDGASVEAGQAILSVEAMKMEHVLRAPTAGVAHVKVAVGDQVARGQVLATVTPAAAAEPTEPDAGTAAVAAGTSGEPQEGTA